MESHYKNVGHATVQTSRSTKKGGNGGGGGRGTVPPIIKCNKIPPKLYKSVAIQKNIFTRTLFLKVIMQQIQLWHSTNHYLVSASDALIVHFL